MLDVYGNDAVVIGISNGGIWNFSPSDFNTAFYLKAVSASGEEYISDNGSDVSFVGCDGPSLSGFSAIMTYLPSLGEGEYKAYVMYKGPQGNLLPLPVPLTDTYYLDMTVDPEGNISFGNSNPDEKATIVVTELSPMTTVLSNQPTDFSISIENT